MARRRFSLVLTGARGEVAKTKYLERLKGMGQGAKIGTKGNRPDSKTLYINSFGADLPETIYYRVSALQPSWDGLKTALTGRTKETIAGTDHQIRVTGFKAARAVRRTKDSTGTATPSELTGLRYLKYNRTSISAPFGQKNATDTEGQAQSDIRALITGNYTVSFIEERM